MLENSAKASPLQSKTISQLARFAAIGGLNTALDFLVLNFLAAWLHVSSGLELGMINILSFTCALAHSYVWNRGWTFTEDDSLAVTLKRSVIMIVLAVLVLASAVLGAKFEVSLAFYLLILFVFLLVEVVFWRRFGVRFQAERVSTQELFKFVVVSLVGLLVNSGLLSGLSLALVPYAEAVGGAGMVRNIAKAVATGVSLVWNFIGYKLFVFRK